MILEENDNKSVKAASKSNKSTVSSNSLNASHILLLELEAMKKQDEIDEQLAAKELQAEIRKKQEEMHMKILAEELEIANLEEESAREKQVANQEIEIARSGIGLKLRQQQKVKEQLQPWKAPQKSHRTFKVSSTSKSLLQGLNCVRRRTELTRRRT